MGRQLSLLSKLGIDPPRKEHGGELADGHRKQSRPLDTRRPLHVVLRSSRARGGWSLRRPERQAAIRAAMRRMARRFAVRIYEYCNAGNHIHMVVRAKCRFAVQNFLRAFAGVAARIATGARKGHPVGRFWDWLAYSRIVGWGRDFWGTRAYVLKNELETSGQLAYETRARRKMRGQRAQSRASPA